MKLPLEHVQGRKIYIVGRNGFEDAFCPFKRVHWPEEHPINTSKIGDEAELLLVVLLQEAGSGAVVGDLIDFLNDPLVN